MLVVPRGKSFFAKRCVSKNYRIRVNYVNFVKFFDSLTRTPPAHAHCTERVLGETLVRLSEQMFIKLLHANRGLYAD
jgi:hypothetical protein